MGKRIRRMAHDAADSSPAHTEIAKELPKLEALDLNALRSRWLQVTGRRAPRAFRSALLRRALAHELQVAAWGGLSPAVKRRLGQLAAAARDGRFEEVLGASSIKPGTLLIRIWQGTTHRVMVLPDGYAWNGITYGSLSPASPRLSPGRTGTAGCFLA